MADEDEYAFYARDLYLPAMRAEGDAAERARAARDREAEDEARKSGAVLRERVRQLAAAAGVRGSPPPQVVADEAMFEAELARVDGRPDPALWASAAEANEQLGNRVAAAYARLRKAEALLETGAGRDAVTETLRAAHGEAADCGAEVLRDRCEGLARRARVALSDEPAPATVDDPSGLTPREREVLVLVAAGRTNRQIGEELFMSEKTASVHVSRILAKLEVATRGEAGAVAHRLGMDARKNRTHYKGHQRRIAGCKGSALAVVSAQDRTSFTYGRHRAHPRSRARPPGTATTGRVSSVRSAAGRRSRACTARAVPSPPESATSLQRQAAGHPSATSAPSGVMMLAIEATGLVKTFGEVRRSTAWTSPRTGPRTRARPNGAGKTTTIRMLATLLRPTRARHECSGTTSSRGRRGARPGDPDRPASLRRRGPERAREPDPDRPVARAQRAEAKARATELLDAFGIAEAATRLVKNSPCGMRRRLDIASTRSPRD